MIPLRGILEAELRFSCLRGLMPWGFCLDRAIDPSGRTPLAFVNRLNLLRAERP